MFPMTEGSGFRRSMALGLQVFEQVQDFGSVKNFRRPIVLQGRLKWFECFVRRIRTSIGLSHLLRGYSFWVRCNHTSLEADRQLPYPIF